MSNEILSEGWSRSEHELINSGIAPVTSVIGTSELLDSVYVGLTGVGTIAATVELEYSDDGATWTNGGTLSLSNATELEGVFSPKEADGKLYRIKLTAISGTDANVEAIAIQNKAVTFRVPLEYLVTE